MPIKWSAFKVSEAVDKVEAEIKLVDPFFARALAEAKEARKIDSLPLYLDQRIARLIEEIERIKGIRDAIERVRRDLPENALEEERARGNIGDQQSLI